MRIRTRLLLVLPQGRVAVREPELALDDDRQPSGRRVEQDVELAAARARPELLLQPQLIHERLALGGGVGLTGEDRAGDGGVPGGALELKQLLRGRLRARRLAFLLA